MQSPAVTYNWFKDFHPTCLTYVPGSAKLTDAAGAHQVEPYIEIAPGYIAADFYTLGLKVVSDVGPTSVAPVFSAQYKVGSCTPGTPMTTGIAYAQAQWGTADDSTEGPSITVGGTTGGGTGGGTGSSGLTGLLGGLGSSA
ncbi:hypothetical protein EBN03_11785 [Nocardia stercoris]|uniref:Uncharacterized protein n=1 Tax=Nocardia stercoris TaxID=2483361 RepID=A0A3M2L6M6_9NOCA|nr:hypothetical protein EBN03_11785 [Nocardia stercoris]